MTPTMERVTGTRTRPERVYLRRRPQRRSFAEGLVRADSPMSWEEFERIESEQLAGKDERERRIPMMIRETPVTWQQVEAERQRRRLMGEG